MKGSFFRTSAKIAARGVNNLPSAQEVLGLQTIMCSHHKSKERLRGPANCHNCFQLKAHSWVIGCNSSSYADFGAKLPLVDGIQCAVTLPADAGSHWIPCSSRVLPCEIPFHVLDCAPRPTTLIPSASTEYFWWSTWDNKAFELVIIFHASLARRTQFCNRKGRSPSPPLHFCWQIRSHEMTWVDTCCSESPQKKFVV